MLKKSEGIIIYSVKYGDSGKILHIYTEEFGMLPFIAQGFNSKSNLKHSHFQHLNIVEIDFYHKEKAKLQRLKESRLIIDNSDLEVNRLYLLIFTAEIMKSSIKEEEKNQHLYKGIKKWILELHSESKITLKSLLHLFMELSKHLGFYPLNNEGKYFNLMEGSFKNKINDAAYTLSEAESQYLRKLLNTEEEFSSKQLKELLDIQIRYFSYHIQNFKEPKSLQWLEIFCQ